MYINDAHTFVPMAMSSIEIVALPVFTDKVLLIMIDRYDSDFVSPLNDYITRLNQVLLVFCCCFFRERTGGGGYRDLI